MAKLDGETSDAVTNAMAPRFKELEIVSLADHFDGPDGRIPSGTQGTILQVFGRGEAYQIEFEGLHDVPETVPAFLLVPHARSAER